MNEVQVPRRAKVKMTRTVTEIAIVFLDRDGAVEEIEDIHEEISWDDCEIDSILAVLSVHP